MQTTRIALLLAGLLLHSSLLTAQESGRPDSSVLDQYRDAAVAKWEDEIHELDQLNESEVDPVDGILLVGSSSIRLWKNAAADMAPYRTIRRGYGGAKYSDLAVYAERLIHPHQYRALVMFVGNDVSGAKNDHTPDEVEALVRYVIAVSRRHQSEAPILIVEVTPTPRRLDAWPKIRQLNARLREITQTEANTYFVATADHYLDRDNKPLASLFGDDRLHQNDSGYSVWSGLIRRRLDEVFRMLASNDPKPTDKTDKTH